VTISAPSVSRTIATEKKTVAAMVRIYCAEHQDGAGALCGTCAALQRYAHARLDACPYGADKPTCQACPIHCYKPAEREAMREVMRFAGPRMMLRHPWLSIVHLWKERFHRAPRGRSKK
jgi:MinD superfamily P-loop ATPase